MIFTVRDWKLQHKEFHEIFNEFHPKKELNNEDSQPFVWPKREQCLYSENYTGRKNAEQPSAMVYPFNLCMFPENNPLLMCTVD